METLIPWVLEHLNYWVVTLFMAIESSFIPFPSEVVVPPAAWMSMSSAEMNIFLVVVFATVGADIGGRWRMPRSTSCAMGLPALSSDVLSPPCASS